MRPSQKSITFTSVSVPNRQPAKVRRVIYALPEEEWRIKALLLVLDIYDWSGPSWRPDLERAIGALLGYERSDIEHFIELLPQRAS